MREFVLSHSLKRHSPLVSFTSRTAARACRSSFLLLLCPIRSSAAVRKRASRPKGFVIGAREHGH